MAARPTVLIIDDDADFVESVRSILEAQGYVVLVADSGRAGLRMLREQRPGLVILDIMMESITEGYGVNQAIRFQPEYEAVRDTPVLMVSSIQETPDERFPRAEELEMIRPDRYLTKPLDIPRFLELVERMLPASAPGIGV